MAAMLIGVIVFMSIAVIKLSALSVVMRGALY